MSSHWTGVFPCRQAAASSVAKTPSEKIVPTRGVPLGSGGLLSDQGTSSWTRGLLSDQGASSRIRGPPLRPGGLLSDWGPPFRSGGLLSDRGASSRIRGPPLRPGDPSQTRGTPLRSGDLLSDYTMVEEPLLLDRCIDKSVLFSWVCNHPQSSGLIDCANGITKTQLAKYVVPKVCHWSF